MKTNPFENQPDRDPSVLWIGTTDHPETAPIFRWCQGHVDMIAVRPSLQNAIDSPPRAPIDQVLIARTNRCDVATSPTSDDRIAGLRRQHSAAAFLLLRGSLVAPTVALPPTDSSAVNSWVADAWIESISTNEAIAYLDSRRRVRVPPARPTDQTATPIVVVASHYGIAEAYMDAISAIEPSASRWITWQRRYRSSMVRGAATVLWDDSVATPTTGEQWRRRLAGAHHLRHLWATGIASTGQRQVAQQNGIAGIIEKPGCLDCLIDALG